MSNDSVQRECADALLEREREGRIHLRDVYRYLYRAEVRRCSVSCCSFAFRIDFRFRVPEWLCPLPSAKPASPFAGS